ncbi:Os04g0682850 [Oryza sativa Japonica Group]|uniref:Os04g0682850 protein n=1 Tax=Oryza sativa subsp. japonica TaxID=39947 RepID=A0A0P0WGN5_ORYSJ|nr:hypothetical protein EE612_026340 [Oryza sativa]BAS91696.1 Os04g0682850 [Oryza sativa Japonica Group]
MAFSAFCNASSASFARCAASISRATACSAKTIIFATSSSAFEASKRALSASSVNLSTSFCNSIFFSWIRLSSSSHFDRLSWHSLISSCADARASSSTSSMLTSIGPTDPLLASRASDANCKRASAMESAIVAVRTASLASASLLMISCMVVTAEETSL